MNKRFKLMVLVLGFVLLISSMSILLTSCNEGEQEPKDYGTFYTLQEAYDLGYIDMQDLKSIAFYFSELYNNQNDSLGEDFVPTPKDPEALSNEELWEAMLALFVQFDFEYPCQNKDHTGKPACHYLGTYNGHIVVSHQWGSFDGYDMYIEGVLFSFNRGPTGIYVWVI